jgi:hypothetical protein
MSCWRSSSGKDEKAVRALLETLIKHPKKNAKSDAQNFNTNFGIENA